MKIAFFTYLMLEYGGGTARYFEEISSGLKKRFLNLHPAIITFDKKLVERINGLYSLYFFRNFQQELISKKQQSNFNERVQQILYYKVTSLRELKEKIREFDVVYSKNDILEASILKFLVGYNNLKNVIFGFHSPVYHERTKSLQSKFHNILYNSCYYKYLLKDASKFHAINSFDENWLNENFTDKKIYKIFNPFDFEDFHKKSMTFKFRHKWKKNKLNILWVGRLTEEKGADDLIRLVHESNSSSLGDKITWNIVGTGEYNSEIEKIQEIYQNVHFFGFVNNKYMPSVYRSNDVFISTSKFETFPYTFIEAQCFGLPIVSYDIHGCSEIIKNRVNGYLVNSLAEFKSKIYHLATRKVFDKKEISIFIRRMLNDDIIFSQLYEMFTQ